MSDHSEHRRLQESIPIQRVPHKPEKCDDDPHYPQEARPVMFSNSPRTLSLSPRYSPLIDSPYMEQCFDNVQYLAEGSFGIVYQAKSKDDGRNYAVKQLKQRFRHLKSGHRVRRLEEVERYASIPRSRFCVELIRAWEEKQYLYVQMELCSVTLTQYAARNDCVGEEILWKILLDVLLGLRHLHSHKFVHLDIKPDNILVSYDNIFKLADFGLMVDLSEGPVSDAQDGDARYLPPEVLKAIYTEAADIFCLGLTMFELGCAVQLPSHGNLWQELRSGNLPFRPFICQSAELFEVIKSMAAPEPEDRPSAEKLLKCKKLQKINRGRCVQTLFHGVTATLKSFCTYSKMAAVNCGMQVFKPFASRVCPVLWRREAGNLKKEKEIAINRGCDAGLSPPLRQQETAAIPGTSRTQTPAEAELFRARLAACKKRLTFDEDEGNVAVGQPAPPIREDTHNEPSAGANGQLSTPKRRRLFD